MRISNIVLVLILIFPFGFSGFKAAEGMDHTGFDSSDTLEYLDFNSLRINGVLPFITTTSDLYKVLGEPDSISVPEYSRICGSFFETGFKYAYYKKSEFEILGEKAVCGSLNFRMQFDLKLMTPYLILDHNTTLEELKKFFPEAVSKQKELNVLGIGKTIRVRLATSISPTDDSWILFFDEGKLIRIDYWMPC